MIRFLKLLDRGSKKVEFLVDGQSTFNTIFGGLLNLISYFISLLVFGYFLNEITERNKPRVIINQSFKELPDKIDFNQIDLILSHQHPTNFSWMLPTSDTFNIAAFSMGKYENGTDYRIPFNMIPCNIAEFSSDEIKQRFASSRDLTNALCIDKSDLRSKNLTLMTRGKFGIANFSSVFFVFEKCKLNCSEEGKKIMQRVYFNMDLIDNTYDSKDYKNPTKPVIKKYFWLLENANYKAAIFEVNSLEFKDDIGFLLEDFKYTKSYQFAKTYSLTTSDPRTTGYGSISFQGGTDIVNIVRSYMKIQEVLSLVGGISNFCLICTILISKFYNDSKFDKKMIDMMIKKKIINIEHLKKFFEPENNYPEFEINDGKNSIELNEKEIKTTNSADPMRHLSLLLSKIRIEENLNAGNLNKVEEQQLNETSKKTLVNKQEPQNQIKGSQDIINSYQNLRNQKLMQNESSKNNPHVSYSKFKTFDDILKIGFFFHLFSCFICNKNRLKIKTVMKNINNLMEITNYKELMANYKFTKENGF